MMAFRLAEAFVELSVKGAALVQQQLGKLQSTVTGFVAKSQGLGSSISGVLAGVGAAAALRKITQATTEQEDADIRLRAALGSTGQEVDSTFAKISKLAAEIQRTTTVADEQVVALAAQAITYGAVGDEVDGLVRQTLALSEATGASTTLIIRSLSRLRESGGKDLGRLKSLIPELANASDADVFDFIAKKTALGMDLMKAKASGLSGQIAQLKNAFSDFLETVGQSGVLEFLVGALRKVVGAFAALPPSVQQTIGIFATLAGVVAITVLAFSPIISSISTFISLMGRLLVAIGSLTAWSSIVPAAASAATAVSIAAVANTAYALTADNVIGTNVQLIGSFIGVQSAATKAAGGIALSALASKALLGSIGLLAVAAVAGVIALISTMNNLLNEVDKVQKKIGGFGKITQPEFEESTRIQSILKLEDVDKQKAAIREQTLDLQRALKQAQDDLLPSLANPIGLSSESEPAKRAAAIFKEIDSLNALFQQLNGQDPFRDVSVSAIRAEQAATRTAEALKLPANQLKALNEIIGTTPVDQLRDKLDSLNKAAKAGKISQEQLAFGVNDVREKFLESVAGSSPMDEYQKQLQLLDGAADEFKLGEDEVWEAMERLTEKFRDSIDPIGAYIDKLKEHNSTIGKSQEEVAKLQAIKAAEKLGLTVSTDQLQEIEQAIELGKTLEENVKNMEKMKEAAIKIFEETATPLEKFATELESLSQLSANFPDLLDTETIQRQIAKLREDALGKIDKPVEIEFKPSFVGLQEFNKQLQVSLLKQPSKEDETREKQLKEQQTTNKKLDELIDAARTQKPIVGN